MTECNHLGFRSAWAGFLGTLLTVWFLASGEAVAGPNPTASRPNQTDRALDAGTPEEGEPDPDSPRASVAEYLELCVTGRYPEAERYLELPIGEANRGPELARRLKEVLDRFLWVDLQKLSSNAQGNTKDGLPTGVDEVGQILDKSSGRREPVRLRRRADPSGNRWVFARSTVEQVDLWHSQLENRWLMERLPELLLRPGPRQLLWWQWLSLPLLLVAAWMMGFLLSGVTRRLFRKLFAYAMPDWQNPAVGKTGGPLVLGWMVAIAYALVPFLGLYEPAKVFLNQLLQAGGLLALFWLLLRVIDVGGHLVTQSPWSLTHPASRSLVPIGTRVGKVGLFALALFTLLSQLGYPVGTLVAGLGIGGLALALAAQKTVENLFGALSLAIDQPFRQGDFVRIGELTGNVEAIGLRSTRLRTQDRTLVSIPNGKLAELNIESFSARDRMRFACLIGLVYGTTAEQMRAVVEGFERVLREHPKIWEEAVVVRFKEFAESGLQIEVMAWFETPDYGEFQLIRQEILLQYLQVVENAGTSFSNATRTLRVLQER